MRAQAQLAKRSSPGFGLGLRTPHYADFLAAKQPLDWLEIITDNFLVEGGKPLVMLDRIRRDYPLAMHGVAMSIGAASGIDESYLRQVKALADRIEPLWVSDHLCWIGPGPEQLHDLYPLPYTDEAARHVVAQIKRAQDLLQRRLVLENVSSYVAFASDAASEWQFLSHIAQEADCLLLLDVNNIHVSSVNHRFDPLDYLNALPAHRIQQIHLAGHSDHGDYIVDTHDHPVAPAVWALYAQACKRFGNVATMIERDDHIPPLQELIAELQLARDIAAGETLVTTPSGSKPIASVLPTAAPAKTDSTDLRQVQRRIADYVLDRTPAGREPALALVEQQINVNAQQRLGIYHHAYRARLADVLADSFAKTNLYLGSDAFTDTATEFVVAHPPFMRSLSRYGSELPDYLAAKYPDNPELRELAQLDWDLRTRFDGADATALDPARAHALTQSAASDAVAGSSWLAWASPLHPSVLLRPITSNVVQIWRAIDDDQDVPEVRYHEQPKTLAIWRQGLQPQFQTLDSSEAAFMQRLHRGSSIEETANALAGSAVLPDATQLGAWLQDWLTQGLLKGEVSEVKRAVTHTE